jgi:hypothetical protein
MLGSTTVSFYLGYCGDAECTAPDYVFTLVEEGDSVIERVAALGVSSICVFAGADCF